MLRERWNWKWEMRGNDHILLSICTKDSKIKKHSILKKITDKILITCLNTQKGCLQQNKPLHPAVAWHLDLTRSVEGMKKRQAHRHMHGGAEPGGPCACGWSRINYATTPHLGVFIIHSAVALGRRSLQAISG